MHSGWLSNVHGLSSSFSLIELSITTEKTLVKLKLAVHQTHTSVNLLYKSRVQKPHLSKLPFQQDTDRQAPDRAWHVGGSLSIWKKPKTGKPAPRRALQPELERSCARIVATHRTRSTRVQSSRGSRSRRVQS